MVKTIFVVFLLLSFLGIKGDDYVDDDGCTTECYYDSCSVDDLCITCCLQENPGICADSGNSCPSTPWWLVILCVMVIIPFLLYFASYSLCMRYSCCVKSYPPPSGCCDKFYAYFTFVIVTVCSFIFPLIGSLLTIYANLSNLKTCPAFPWTPWFGTFYAIFSGTLLIQFFILLRYLRLEYLQKYRIFNKRFWREWKNILENKFWMAYFHVFGICLSIILSIFAFVWKFVTPLPQGLNCNSNVSVSLLGLAAYNIYFIYFPVIVLWLWKVPAMPLIDSMAEIKFINGN